VRLSSQTQTCTNATTVAVNACAAAVKNITASLNSIEAPGTASTSCLSSAANARDIWLKFTATNTTATITVNTAAAKNLCVVAYSFTCVSSLITSTVELGCVDANTATAAQTETLVLTGLTIGVDYLIRVIATTAAGASNTSINVNILSPILNDDPAGAFVLPAVTSACSYTLGSLKSGTQTTCGVANPSCGNYGASSVDTWYSVVVPASGNLFLQTSVASGSIGIASYTGTPCGGLTQIGCSQGSPEGSTTGSPSLYVPGLSPGTTVYIRIWNQNGSSACTFSLCATNLGPCGNAANNDFCSNPASMSPSAGTFSSSTTASGTYSYTPDIPGDLGGGVALCSNGFDHNSWYSFVATATTQTFAINVSATNCASGLSAQIFSVALNTYGCCKTFTSMTASCLQGVTGSNTLTATGLSIGQTYYMMMESFGGSAQACTYTVSGWSASGILPIDLITFYGETKGYVNSINWITSTEKDIDSYVLESSPDGITFEKVSEVKASKNSSLSQKYYQTYDSHPYKELTYYRLREVKEGGISNLSHIISVIGPDFYETIHNLYPNPTNSDLNFDFYSKTNNTLKVELLGYAGDVVYEIQYELSEGNNSIVVPMSSLSKGVYILKVVSEKSGKTTHHKIIKN